MVIRDRLGQGTKKGFETLVMAQIYTGRGHIFRAIAYHRNVLARAREAGETEEAETIKYEIESLESITEELNRIFRAISERRDTPPR